MFCVKCGKQIDDSSAFCPYCGSATSVNSAPQPQPAAPQQDTNPFAAPVQPQAPVQEQNPFQAPQQPYAAPQYTPPYAAPQYTRQIVKQVQHQKMLQKAKATPSIF